MRFLVDAQLPPALARWLDFAQRKVLEQDGPAIIWVRLPNSRKGDLLRWFAAMLPQIEEALARGETLIEVV